MGSSSFDDRRSQDISSLILGAHRSVSFLAEVMMSSMGMRTFEREESAKEKETQRRKGENAALAQHVYEEMETLFPAVPEGAEIRIRPIRQDQDEIRQVQKLFAFGVWDKTVDAFRRQNKFNIIRVVFWLIMISGTSIGMCLMYFMLPGKNGEPALMEQPPWLIWLFCLVTLLEFYGLVGYAMWIWPIRHLRTYIEGSLETDMQNPWEYYSLAQPRARFLVAVADIDGQKDVIVGSVAAEPALKVVKGYANYILFPEQWGAKDCEIRRLTVSPGCRRRGVARRLMEAAETFAKGKGFERVVLCVTTLQADAFGMCAQLGFEETHRCNAMGAMGEHDLAHLVLKDVGLKKGIISEKKGK